MAMLETPDDAAGFVEQVLTGHTAPPPPDAATLAHPDLGVLRMSRRPPPAFPLEVLGPNWAAWVTTAAEAAAAPVDYVAMPLLAAASALIGHARWGEANPGWRECPHLWIGCVGDSGSSKSPGSDCLLRDVLPEIERRMLGDFPDRLAEWQAVSAVEEAKMEAWRSNLKKATTTASNIATEPAPIAKAGPEPLAPRLKQMDVTPERVAVLLAKAAPKGLLIIRDELAGWLMGMRNYSDSARAFWLEAYGGRPYLVERVKHPEPIFIPRLAVAVTGSTQPAKLAEMFADADDGLLGRVVWAWPDAIPFRMSRRQPDAKVAIDALDLLRMMEMQPGAEPGDPPRPVMMSLTPAAREAMEAFGAAMQKAQQESGGLMSSAYGKARGLALRLSLVLTLLQWCIRAEIGMDAPLVIDEDTFLSACNLVADYLLPMAERVYGDAAATKEERNAATIARWIVREKAKEVHVPHLLRKVRLPGLRIAKDVHEACGELVDAGWLVPPPPSRFQQRARTAYAVNPLVLEVQP